jgi:hypothetical protein
MSEERPNGDTPRCFVRRWVFRKGCHASHIDKRYGLYVGRNNYGGHGEHYGYTRYQYGVYFCWGHNTWFAGVCHERVTPNVEVNSQPNFVQEFENESE